MINNKLHIKISNLEEELIDAATVTIIPSNSNEQKIASFSKELGIYVVHDLEQGKVLIKVEYKGYDAQEKYYIISNPIEYTEIILGKINSQYVLIDSNKYPIKDFKNNNLSTPRTIDPQWNTNRWAADLINLEAAWNYIEAINPNLKYGNNQITAAIIDNGITSYDVRLPDNTTYIDAVITDLASENVVTGTLSQNISPRITISIRRGPRASLISVSNDISENRIRFGSHNNLYLRFYSITSTGNNTFDMEIDAIDYVVPANIEIIHSGDSTGQFFLLLEINPNNINSTLILNGLITGFEINKRITIMDIEILVEIQAEGIKPRNYESLTIRDITLNRDNNTTTLTTSIINNSYYIGALVTQNKKISNFFTFGNIGNIKQLYQNHLAHEFHGSAIGAILAGRANNHIDSAGIAPNINLVSVITKESSFLNTLKFLCGLRDFFTTNTLSLKRYKNIDVINISMAQLYDQDTLPLNDANNTLDIINRFAKNEKGIPIVFAAGNDNDDTTITACVSGSPTIINVGASTHNEIKLFDSNFSNIARNPLNEITICAPCGILGDNENRFSIPQVFSPNEHLTTSEIIPITHNYFRHSLPITSTNIPLLNNIDERFNITQNEYILIYINQQPIPITIQNINNNNINIPNINIPNINIPLIPFIQCYGPENSINGQINIIAVNGNIITINNLNNLIEGILIHSIILINNITYLVEDIVAVNNNITLSRFDNIDINIIIGTYPLFIPEKNTNPRISFSAHVSIPALLISNVQQNDLYIKSHDGLNIEKIYLYQGNNIVSNQFHIFNINYNYNVGSKIVSKINNDGNGSGTSISAPQVSGAIALMLTVNPNLTAIQIKEILKRTADKIDPISPNNPNNLNKWFSKKEYDEIMNPDMRPALTPVLYYNNWYGYGRLNVLRAVTMSNDFHTNAPRLQLHDNNSAANCPNIGFDNGFIADGEFSENYFDTNITTPCFNANQDNSIFIKVKNHSPAFRGNSSYKAWVRIYLGLSSNADDNFKLGSTKVFNYNGNITHYQTGLDGIFYLDNIDLFNRPNGYLGNLFPLYKDGGIPPQSTYIVKARWPANIVPPNDTSKKTYIVAQILPYDGPIDVELLDFRKNVGYKRILFTNIDCKETTPNNRAIITPRTTEWPTLYEFIDNTNTITKNFNISVSDREYLIPNHIKIQFTGTTIHGIENSIILSYDVNTTNYVLDNTANNNYSNNLEISLTQYTNAEVDGVMTYFFEGTMAFRKDYTSYKIDIIVLEPNTAEQDLMPPTIPLVERYRKTLNTDIISDDNSDTNLDISKKPRLHIFADMDKIAPSLNANDCFTPDSTDPNHKHHITTGFKGIDTNEKLNAYAVMNGLVLIQKDITDDNKVNLFLKPLEQTGLGFTPVKYFVYRGLNKSDFLTEHTTLSPEDIVPNNEQNSEFIKSLYRNLQQRNSDALSIGVDTLSPLVLGINYAQQQYLDTSIDQFFINNDDDNQLPVVSQGMILGTFNNNSFGFEIILEDNNFIPTLAYARLSSFTLEVDSNKDAIEQQVERERILSFIDPAAFFGMHTFAGIYKRDSDGNNKILVKSEDVYSNILTKFTNKHKLYIDIRNDNNYSYNYYKNHTINGTSLTDRLSNDEGLVSLELGLNNPQELHPASLDTYLWPYFSISEIEGSATDKAKVYIKLNHAADNPTPVIYNWNSNIITAKTNARFIDTDLLKNENYSTKVIGLSVALAPNIDVNSSTQNFAASLLKLSLLKKPSMTMVSNHRTLNKETFHDQIFSPLQTILQKRSIVNIDAQNYSFTIDGDYSRFMKSDDVIQIKGANDSSNNKIYTITAVSINIDNQTVIYTNEPFTGTSTPYGEIHFSNHLWNTVYPTQWFSSNTKSLVDTSNNQYLGFSYLANNGIGLEEDNIIFYATPYYHLSRGDNRTIEQLNLIGGTSPLHSFWEVILGNNDMLRLKHTALELPDNTNISVFDFEQYNNETEFSQKETFLALCLTKSELNQIKKALFMSELDDSHNVYLKLKISTSQVDNNNIEYITYEVWLEGWKKTSNQNEADVIYHEVSTAYDNNISPIIVYSLAENSLVFSSKAYGESGSAPTSPIIA